MECLLIFMFHFEKAIRQLAETSPWQANGVFTKK